MQRFKQLNDNEDLKILIQASSSKEDSDANHVMIPQNWGII